MNREKILLEASKYDIICKNKSIQKIKEEILEKKVSRQGFLILPLKVLHINKLNSFELLSYDNSLVYLCGEIHNYQDVCNDCILPKGCVDLTAILYRLTDYSSQIIDLYVESSYMYKDEDSPFYGRGAHSDSPLVDFIEEHQKCFVYDKKNCPIKNIRFHYTDVRYLAGLDEPFNNLRYCKKSIKFIDELYNENILISSLNEFLYQLIFDDKLTGIFVKKLKKYEFTDLHEMHRLIQKQMKNISFEMKENVYTFFRKRFILTLKESIEKEGLYNSWWELFSIRVMYMDIYTLGRFLRNFSKTSNGSIKIVYSGDAHRRTYHAFLKYVGYSTHYVLSGKKCLNFKDHKLLYI